MQTNPIAPSEKGTPWLAEKWEWADNYQKLTLTTRANVKWNDDQPFTAGDVAYLLEPGLDLATFAGTSDLPLSVDLAWLSFMVAALIGVVVAAVCAGTWLSLRASVVDALRIGEHWERRTWFRP